jgi:hypothetical protein
MSHVDMPIASLSRMLEAKPSVLLVEDDRLTRIVLREFLKQLGFAGARPRVLVSQERFALEFLGSAIESEPPPCSGRRGERGSRSCEAKYFQAKREGCSGPHSY